MVGDIKHIVIIESLIDERLTGKEIYDDCIRPRIDFQKRPFTHKYYSITSKQELIELIKYYTINAAYMNGGLLFHFEIHGDAELRGLVTSDRTLISWKELVEIFRPINIVTCNKLFITMATCYGRYLYRGVDPYKKSPYSGYISASKAVYPTEIIEKFLILFEKLIEGGNLVEAYLEMEKTESNFYYKDSKTTFEEAYSSTYEKLVKNEEFKKQFIKESKEIAIQAGQPVPNDEIAEEMHKEALETIYHKQKEAFNFDNCE